METLQIITCIASTLCALILGFATWLIYSLLQETRESNRWLGAISEELGNVRQETQSTAQQVVHQFIKAGNSFKDMVDAIEDTNNLQQIKGRADQIFARLVDVHEKIGSQLDTSGWIISELHQLVVLWSKEGTELKQSYEALARAIEQVLLLEAEKRERLGIQLQTWLNESARGR